MNRRNHDHDPHAPRRDRRRAIPEEPGSGPAPHRPPADELASNAARLTKVLSAEQEFFNVIESNASDELREAAWRTYRQARGNDRYMPPMPPIYRLGGAYHAGWLELQEERSRHGDSDPLF